MGWTIKPPGAKDAVHKRAIDAIDDFEAAYRDAMANPLDPYKRTLADSFVVRATRALESVGATPGHASLDKWGLADVAFLHEDPKTSVSASDVSRPVLVALGAARKTHQERADAERRKRRNPLRWAVFGFWKFAALLTEPPRKLAKWAFSDSAEPVPAPLVLIFGLVSFVVVAGVTVTLLV